jgi:hypothetical protein
VPLTHTLGTWDARAQDLAGWSVNVHHVYDPVGETLYLGDGGEGSPAFGSVINANWLAGP